MSHQISAIEISHFRLPLYLSFRASWDPNPRTSHTSTIGRAQAGTYEGVGSGNTILGFAGHEHLFIGRDPFEIERRDFRLPHPILPDETGHIALPDKPGLGVEIDWQHFEPLRIDISA